MFPSFSILGREVYLYNVCGGIGIIAALLVVMHLSRRRGLECYVVEAGLWAAIPAVLGGVLLYGLTNAGYIAQVVSNAAAYPDALALVGALVPAFSGSVFYGGALGAAAGIWLWALRHMRPRTGDLMDLYAVGLPLFHGFGRIGCFLGGCCFGIPCEHGLTYTHNPIEMANGVPRFPVQLLEAALEFGIFALVLVLFLRDDMRGRLLMVWTLAYACVRFLDEFLRGDTYRGFFGPLSTSQWISLVLLLAIVIVSLRSSVRANAPASGTARKEA